MKKNFKLNLNWKQIIALGFILTFVYGFILYLFDNDQSLKMISIQSLIYGVTMTLFFIFLFPWLMEKIVGKKLNNITPDLLDNEKIEDEIFANLFRGIEGVGGKIYLTNNRLIFKSHTLNLQKGQTNIDYAIVHSVSKRKTAKLFDNGIKVATKDGKAYNFVVNERDDVLKKIQDRITL